MSTDQRRSEIEQVSQRIQGRGLVPPSTERIAAEIDRRGDDWTLGAIAEHLCSHVYILPHHGGSLAGGARVGIAGPDQEPSHGDGDYPSDAEAEAAAARLASEEGLPVRRWP